MLMNQNFTHIPCEKIEKYMTNWEEERLTVCESPSFCICGDSKWAVESSRDKEFGLNRCSNIAIITNIDINIAVARKPKEMAFMDVVKLFH